MNYRIVVSAISTIDIFLSGISLLLPCWLFEDRYIDNACNLIDQKYALIIGLYISLSFLRAIASSYVKIDLLFALMTVALSGTALIFSMVEMATFGSNEHLLVMYYCYAVCFMMNTAMCIYDVYTIHVGYNTKLNTRLSAENYKDRSSRLLRQSSNLFFV